ncbi:hypothetical protein D3C73_1349720 [compost metagenome]
MDQPAAVGKLFGVVALGPDAGELAEVGSLELFAVGVVPQADGHRRKVPGTHQLAFFTNHRLTLVVPYLHGHAQALALDLATAHRLPGVAVDETGDDVGAA